MLRPASKKMAEMRRDERYFDWLETDVEKAERKGQFLAQLRLFYKRKWNCPLVPPTISGLEVDLFEFYEAVQRMGGWQQVCRTARWFEVVQDCLKIDADVTALAEHMVKLVYMRYLAHFEAEQNGVDLDGDFQSFEAPLSSSRGGSGRSHRGLFQSLVSVGANGPAGIRRRATIPQSARASFGLAQMRQETNYARLVKSLNGGLPNEVDFALNVVCLLSLQATGPRFLQLIRTPQLVDSLVAQAGIFSDDSTSLRCLYEQAWRSQSGKNLVDFWYRAVEDRSVQLALLGPPDTEAANESRLFPPELDAECRFGLRNPLHFRVYQVASILRNLSFENPNKTLLARNEALLKFLCACVHSRWPVLKSTGLDILANIASEIVLPNVSSSLAALMLRTLSDCLQRSDGDKLVLIRALETVACLARRVDNEACLSPFLGEALLARLVSLVAVKDIMICVYVMESLLTVSEMADGGALCERLAQLPRCVDTLVAMTTVEAVSFGPSGLLGMKVVQYEANNQHSYTAVMAHKTDGPPPPEFIGVVAPTQTAAQFRPRATPTRVAQHPEGPSEAHKPSGAVFRQPYPPSDTQQAQCSTGSRLFSGGGVVGGGPAMSVGGCPAGEEGDKLTRSWLKENCRVDVNSMVSRGELYASYVADMHRGGTLAVSVHQFTNLLKTTIPTCTLRMVAERSQLMNVEGVRFLAKQNSAADAENAATSRTAPLMSTVAMSHPNLANRLACGAQQPLISPPSDNDVSAFASIRPPGGSTPWAPLPLAVHANMKLEVCQEAKKAKDLVSEEGKSAVSSPTVAAGHEAKIVRMENTTCSPILLVGQKKHRQRLTNGDGGRKVNGLIGHREKKLVAVLVKEKEANCSNVSRQCSTELLSQEAASNAADAVSPPPPLENGENPLKKVTHCQGNGNCGTDDEEEEEEDEEEIEDEQQNGDDGKNEKQEEFEICADVKSSRKRDGGSRRMSSKRLKFDEEREQTFPNDEVQQPCSSGQANNIGTAGSSGAARYMCEWNGCGALFSWPTAVSRHCWRCHVTEPTGYCRWPKCNGEILRQKWSLMTHVQDNHCCEAALEMAARRRHEVAVYGKSSLPEPRPPPPHPGYTKSAAIDAIRRHAFATPLAAGKEITEESEGPVTKSLRLTSSLILRNLAKHSPLARRQLVRHEPLLCQLALSRLESSTALAQCLASVKQAETEGENG